MPKKTIKKYNPTLIKLLSLILQIVRKEDKDKSFFLLIIIVFFQAFLDVLSVASIVPLIYLAQDQDLAISNLKNYFKILFINNNYLINNNQVIALIPILVIFLITIATFFRLYLIYRTNKYIEDIRHNISMKLMNNYIWSNFQIDRNTSEIAKSILSEVDQFIIIVFQPTILMITNLILLLGIVFYLLLTNLKASIYGLTILIIFYLCFHYFSKGILNKEGYKSEESNRGRFITAIESFRSIKDIKIYNAENFFSKRFKNFSRSFANTNAIYTSLTASPKYILEMIVFISLAFSIFLFEVNGDNNFMILPLLGTFAFAAYKAQPALSSVIYGINSIEYGAKIILNLNSHLKKNSSKIKNKYYRYEDLGSKNKNSIIIKGLSYFYKKERNINFLNNINLEIKYNSLFLIIGESGSGKSTLLNLISCLIKPTKGEITFNTHRSSGKKPKISYLHQNHYLYNTSIAKNIAFGVPENFIDYERVKKVLKKAEIYNYVYKLKNNINENVGENGSKLSTGQIQRIALARALYFEPEILILDEPTSALDKKNELGILKTLIKISQEITVIMSTHKTFNLLDLSDVSFIDLSKSNN